jgi:hypothetical protein
MLVFPWLEIPKGGEKEEGAEEVQEVCNRIDRSALIRGAEEIKVIEEALDGRRFRLKLKYRATRDGFKAYKFH